MLLLDPLHRNSVMRMDLEYGKVVDEWKVSDVVDVNNILPEYVVAGDWPLIAVRNLRR